MIKDLNTPIWQLTVGELFDFMQEHLNNVPQKNESSPVVQEDRFVYGLTGLGKLLNCSVQTALKVKKSGKIDAAIIQTGRKIIVDAPLVLELLGKNATKKR